MGKTALLKPFFIHILISILAIVVFNIINGFEKLMVNEPTRNIIYIVETIIVILLYFFFSSRVLKKLPNKIVLYSITIIITINLILGLSGYLMLNYSSQIVVENGQFLILILMYFNYGFNPLLSLSSLPDFLGFY